MGESLGDELGGDGCAIGEEAAGLQPDPPRKLADTFGLFGELGDEPALPVDGEQGLPDAMAHQRPAIRSLRRIEAAGDEGGADIQGLGGCRNSKSQNDRGGGEETAKESAQEHPPIARRIDLATGRNLL
jgi:hypothetical protein